MTAKPGRKNQKIDIPTRIRVIGSISLTLAELNRFCALSGWNIFPYILSKMQPVLENQSFIVENINCDDTMEKRPWKSSVMFANENGEKKTGTRLILLSPRKNIIISLVLNYTD